MIATSATFLISLFILFQFDSSNTGFQMVEEGTWIMGMNYKMGVDGISVLFVMLTTFMMPLTILASWDVKLRVKEYMIAFLLLETLMLGVFMALDLVLFFLFFDLSIVGMYLSIHGWGHGDRRRSALLFFLYTFLGSLALLLGFTMWLTFRLNPSTMDPVQQQVFSIMPWVLMFVMAPFAAGLLLYWNTSNLLTLAQQKYLYSKHPQLKAAAEKEKAEKAQKAQEGA